jgi:hypothetical protein
MADGSRRITVYGLMPGEFRLSPPPVLLPILLRISAFLRILPVIPAEILHNGFDLFAFIIIWLVNETIFVQLLYKSSLP